MANEFFKTTNGGQTFTYASLPGVTGTFVPLQVFWGVTGTPNDLYIVGSMNGAVAIWRSTNVGATWTKALTPFYTLTTNNNILRDFVGMVCAPSGDLVALLGIGSSGVPSFGAEGPWRYSSDHGVTWTTAPMNASEMSPDFFPRSIQVLYGQVVTFGVRIDAAGVPTIEVWADLGDGVVTPGELPSGNVLLHSPRGWHDTAAGRRYTVVVSGVPAGQKNWQLRLHLATAADTVFVAQVYLTGNQTLPGENVAAGAIVKVEVVVPPIIATGTYNFRFFGPGNVKHAMSPNFTIVRFG